MKRGSVVYLSWSLKKLDRSTAKPVRSSHRNSCPQNINKNGFLVTLSWSVLAVHWISLMCPEMHADHQLFKLYVFAHVRRPPPDYSLLCGCPIAMSHVMIHQERPCMYILRNFRSFSVNSHEKDFLFHPNKI
jgi:hypothetical protein